MAESMLYCSWVLLPPFEVFDHLICPQGKIAATMCSSIAHWSLASTAQRHVSIIICLVKKCFLFYSVHVLKIPSFSLKFSGLPGRAFFCVTVNELKYICLKLKECPSKPANLLWENVTGVEEHIWISSRHNKKCTLVFNIQLINILPKGPFT